MKETILQFGTGNFLRGFADSFVDSLRRQGLYDGKIVIVSPTDSAAVEKINAQNGAYHLLLRGVENGEEVFELKEIAAVSRAINPYRDFNAFLALAGNPDLRFVISNTTEAGICCNASCRLQDRPAASFPGKLTQFLFERYRRRLGGLIILACELIENNGRELERCVLHYARQWGLGEEFAAWLRQENRFCSTLVDRIVTGFPQAEAEQLFAKTGCRDLLLDTAEPYHLWVIEGNFERELPFQRAGLRVIWTDDVAPYKRMKVRILNGAHTSLVFPSLLCGVETVKDSLDDALLNEYLHTCLFGCILPALGETSETRQFAEAVLERFRNPFIRHLWKSIFLNSVSKFAARVLPTITDYQAQRGVLPKPLVFSLACLIRYYKEQEPADGAAAIAFIKTQDVSAILANTELWGKDLRDLLPLVRESLRQMETNPIREAIKWSIS